MRLRIFISGQKRLGALTAQALSEIQGVTVGGASAPCRHPDDSQDELWAWAERRGIPVSPAAYYLEARRVPGGADLIVCAHSHEYVTAGLRAGCRYGAIGYHPSLLPKFRGADAVTAAVKAGERVTGGSVYILDDGWDTGEVIAQVGGVEIREGETARELWRRTLLPLGVQMLRDAVGTLASTGSLRGAEHFRAATAVPDDWETWADMTSGTPELVE